MGKTKVSLTAAQISENWQSKMKSAVSRITTGVNNVSTSPMEKAANAKEKWLTGIQNAANNGTWENGLRSVTLSDWKSRTINKVQTNLATGVDNAMTKRRTFDTWLVENLNQVLPEIDALPTTTKEDNINKAVAYMRAMGSRSYK